ncbi:MAG: type IV toxin-antitoxin system AbiEi family antitoxin domain-containing protein [Actinobacteria bacterium]|nr:type IV toxin-antitoxin system AbiEi family antitoxin domain-containing protein [Actinomycetota bacterium]
MTVISYSQWIDSGRTRAALRAAVASGEVVRLRRGSSQSPGIPAR